MVKRSKKKTAIKAGSKEIYEFIKKHPRCSVPDIAKKFPNNPVRSIWSMVSALKKKGLVDNKWKGQWKATTTEHSDVKVVRIIIDVNLHT